MPEQATVLRRLLAFLAWHLLGDPEPPSPGGQPARVTHYGTVDVRGEMAA